MDRKDNNNNINNKDDVTRVINKKDGYHESGYSYDKGFNDSKEPFGSDSVSSGSKRKNAVIWRLMLLQPFLQDFLQ